VGKNTVRIDESATTQKILKHSASSRSWDSGLFCPTAATQSPSAPFDLIAVELSSVTKATAKHVFASEWVKASASASCPPPGSGDGDAD